MPLPVEWNSCLTHMHRNDYQSRIVVFPSALLSAARTCQGTEDSLGSIAGSLSSTEQVYGRKPIIGTGRSSSWAIFRTRHAVHPEQVHSQWRISPFLTVLGHRHPETTAGLSILHQLHPFCAQDRAFPSIAFHSVTTISKLALNYDEICPIHSKKR